MAGASLCRQTPKVGARCVNCARRDLCGGCRVTSIPTAIQRGTQTRLWARKGTRPRVVRQQQSESAYIFGAVCPQCDMAVGLVLPFANTQTMALHLEAISEAVPPGRHALLILDQAGWHTTLKLPQLPNLSLLMLPAGSPELNPTEQVWQQLRDRSLANWCYDN